MNFMDRLTLREQFKLIEIAHEAGNMETRSAALALLRQINAPPMMIVAREGFTDSSQPGRHTNSISTPTNGGHTATGSVDPPYHGMAPS